MLQSLKSLPNFFLIILIGFLTAFIVVLADWTAPRFSPPSCPVGTSGCDLPLNISSSTQTKTGGLVINGTSSFMGNVGIGTPAPSAKLTIREDTGNSMINFDRGGSIYGVFGINTINEMIFQANTVPMRFSANGFANTHMQITTSGNVGIGTTGPTRRLEVTSSDSANFAQSITHTNAVTSYGLLIDAGNGISDTNLRLRSRTGTDFVFVRGDGNVGIGITTPATKLDVAGDINATRLCITGTCQSAWPSSDPGLLLPYYESPWIFIGWGQQEITELIPGLDKPPSNLTLFQCGAVNLADSTCTTRVVIMNHSSAQDIGPLSISYSKETTQVWNPQQGWVSQPTGNGLIHIGVRNNGWKWGWWDPQQANWVYTGDADGDPLTAFYKILVWK